MFVMPLNESHMKLAYMTCFSVAVSKPITDLNSRTGQASRDSNFSIFS